MTRRTIRRPILITLAAAFLLAACTAVGKTLPTAAAIPTQTAAATAIPTLTAAATAASNTPTPTAQAALVMGDRLAVDEGGYSLQVPEGFTASKRGGQMTVSNTDQSFLMSMSLAPRKDDMNTSAARLERFVANVKKDLNDLTVSGQYGVTVGGCEGLAVDVTGTLMGEMNTVRIVVVDTGEPGFFVAFAFMVDGADGLGWQTTGRPALEAILQSVEFYAPVNASAGAGCTVSTDDSYGYSEDNPIRVGGDAYDGPPRERAYLDNLAGPAGEPITYERSGSFDYGGTILDIFVISGLGEPVALYVDEYSFSEPQAPAGFTCKGGFGLSAP